MLDFPQDSLPIMEIFYTLQGEGYHSGRAAIFIRTSGCEVGCVWCDVKESWNILENQYKNIASILNEIENFTTNFIVLTGGEPLMHDLTLLTNTLKEKGYEIAIETSGTEVKSGTIDWYCFSPKKFKKPLEEAYSLANELKIIINHPSDFTWAEMHAEKVNKNCLLYLQPEWEKQERYLPLVIDYIKKNPKWKISLQTHKLMNIP
jgi:7-carboxy-7-deazaguanine synthase